MSEKNEKAGTEEAVGFEGAQCCPDMCREMMTGKLPDCCGTQMREMMSRGLPENCGAKMREMMSRFVATPEKAESKTQEA